MTEPITKDRITLAWELRRDIHAFLADNPMAIMQEIFAQFSHRKTETVRKAVLRMRSDGDVCMLGKRGHEGAYSAVTESIKPMSYTRSRLSEGGRKNQPIAARATRPPRKKKEMKLLETALAAAQDRDDERAANDRTTYDVYVGGKLQHKAGSVPSITQNQRGQGALRRRVYVNCFTNF